ncbi:Erp4p Ecym_4456 [Eremothecium cymbalariae DBVPG|uniref:GOLD domain-containing protein n=1 Tax=Eremothecium cymbalariae (strain CBS 270.75 / DBVPG 7215 / KCTC 17166 / NRRL Y-17582) TaxID=931890 RepID=G8JTZ6_ERECY|nr:hypothetical protein Ecym_4456 [Eremothecium cymbalariae DBVPG\
MFLPLVFLASLLSTLCAAGSSQPVPVAITLPAFSKECLYYELTSNEDSIVASFQVLTGGNFEIDYKITGPDNAVIVDERQKNHADMLLRSFGLGEYSFCFTNAYGTVLKKVEVNFELAKEDIDDTSEETEDIIALNAIEEISRNLNKITNFQNLLRVREWRNMSTVESTESRLVWLSVLTMGVMVGISILQSLVVQFFFKDRHRNYV